MYVVIDLFGDEDVISTPPEKSTEEIKQEELMRRYTLEEIFKRSPQPQVIPIED